MFASKHPFRDTLVIEIDREEVLKIHGAVVDGSEYELLSILEAFHAGTDMSRFAREDDRHDDPSDDQLNPQFRNHGEEIAAAIATAKKENWDCGKGNA